MCAEHEDRRKEESKKQEDLLRVHEMTLKELQKELKENGDKDT